MSRRYDDVTGPPRTWQASKIGEEPRQFYRSWENFPPEVLDENIRPSLWSALRLVQDLDMPK